MAVPRILLLSWDTGIPAGWDSFPHWFFPYMGNSKAPGRWRPGSELGWLPLAPLSSLLPDFAGGWGSSLL